MINLTVNEILKTKGSDVHTIASESPVIEALVMLSHYNIGALVVVEPSGVVGIFSERDYTRKMELNGLSSKETKVREVMSKSVLYVTPDTTVNEAMAIMTSKHIRHLPVLLNDKLVGFISIGDVVKATLDQKDFAITQLEHYICGGPCPI